MLSDEYRYRILKLLEADPHASQRRIAEELGISLGTVRSHITSIYRKLQVHNVAEAVSRAVRQRLI